MKSWVEVSEARLAANYKLLQEAAGGTTAVLAVVKANAYGHGARVCAPVLARAGAEWLGVTDVAEGGVVRLALEAERVRQPEIMVMCGLLEEDADAVVEHGLTAVVWTLQQMEWLSEAVARRGGGSRLPVHVEVDTGMARQGVLPGENLRTLLDWLKQQDRLRLDGVMTHLASSEVAGSAQTTAQRRRFAQAIKEVAATDLQAVWVHAGNTSTVDNRDGEENLLWLQKLAASVGARPMVRTGIGLYGYCLPVEGEAKPEVRGQLLPVMRWKTRVIGVREVQAGDTVGYNGTFAAPRPMRLALLPIGYADGLRRELSGSDAKAGGWVMLHGQRAAIVGRVSMNLTIVDVSGIADASVGDEAMLLGDGVTADDHARLAQTIAYEIMCGVRTHSHLVP